MRAVSIAALALVCVAAGCARRAMPYQFRAPVVAGVRAAEIPHPRVETVEPRQRSRARTQARAARRGAPALATTRRAAPGEVTLDPRSEPLVVSPAVATLYGLVGQRDEESNDIDLALRAVRALGAAPAAELASVDSGQALVELARSREAYPGNDPPLIGDLVIFDAVRGDEPASLVGVVVGARGDGTVEFIYLARGIVRRGWVNARQPNRKRDDRGRVLNTFVRHSEGRDPRGTRYLAGELLAGYVRIDRLTRQ